MHGNSESLQFKCNGNLSFKGAHFKYLINKDRKNNKRLPTQAIIREAQTKTAFLKPRVTGYSQGSLKLISTDLENTKFKVKGH